MRFVEATGAAWTAEQLRAAEAELEMQKREWEANRLAAMQKEEQLLKQETESEELLTYSRKDASNQVNTKQDSNLSKRTSIVGVGGIRLTKHNKRDKRFKQHGMARGGPGLSRSVSNHRSRSNVQQASPVRTRRSSLNVSAPARSSCNTNNSSKKSVTGTLPAPSRRQTRLHSLGEDNVTVTATATPPTRKTTRTAMAAAGGTSTPISEERPKRQSANIAMAKLMKTPVRPAAAIATTSAKNTTQATKPKRRESVSLTTSAANRRKLLERRATIASPLALKDNDSEDEAEDDTNEKDDDEEGDGDSEEDDASIQMDDDEDKDEDEQEDEEETVVSDSASASAQEDTTQTEDEELHVERLDAEEEEDEEEEEEQDDEELNVETQSSSSYATAGEGGDSLDGWNAHTQVQDTTMTSSTYYNVSEESDTDEPNDPLSVSKAENKSETKEATPSLQRQRSNSSRGGSDEPIGHTPRTRSRGSVKINLWTLDVSPVLNIQKGTGSGAGKNMLKRTTPQVETKLKGRQRQQAGASKRLMKKVNEGQTTTLSRWITQTPRVRLRSSNAGVAMPSNSSGNTSAVNVSAGVAVAAKTGANGASTNR